MWNFKTKVCLGCKRRKPISAFYWHKLQIFSNCKKCQSAAHKKWALINRQQQSRYMEAWRLKHRKRNKKYAEEYRKKNRKLFADSERIRRKLIKANGGRHTEAEWKALCLTFKKRCAACHKKKKLVRDHIVSVKQGGTSNIENIQPLCINCNAKKHANSVTYILRE